jgi:hypothetical protein
MNTRISLLSNRKSRPQRAAPVSYGQTTTDRLGNFVFKLKTILQPNEPLRIRRSFDPNETLAEFTANAQGSFAANTKIPIPLPIPWPTIDWITPDTGFSSTDGVTTAIVVTVFGTGLPGGTARLFVDGVSIRMVKIGTDGKWSIKIGTLARGRYSLTATVTDGELKLDCPRVNGAESNLSLKAPTRVRHLGSSLSPLLARMCYRPKLRVLLRQRPPALQFRTRQRPDRFQQLQQVQQEAAVRDRAQAVGLQRLLMRPNSNSSRPSRDCLFRKRFRAWQSQHEPVQPTHLFC